MSKNTKNQKKKHSVQYKKIILIALLLVLVVSGLCYFKYRIKPTVAQAEISPMREMILMAAGAAKKDAPVEAKTGDVYFPGARLFVPPPQGGLDVLTYSFYDDGKTEPDFSVSNKRIFNINASQLYAANNLTELFEKIPKLQACQRGINIRYTQTNETYVGTLKQTVPLPNGKNLYMYVDSSCPEIEELLPLLKQIKTY